MPSKPNLIVIVGPTAVGKSEIAVRLAKGFGGEIVSADSRQVYRGLDIGTGKITKDEMRGVPHHLLDVADPRRPFSVVEFQRLAERSIRDIVSRSKLPFLVGGTAFWVDAAAYGMELPRVPPDKKLRRRLAARSPHALLTILKRLDPERARTIEPQNPRRLIRAIEIAKVIGPTPKVRRRRPYRLLWIGVWPPTGYRQRVTKRITAMLRAGLVREVSALLRSGFSRTRIGELGFEYRAAAEYLDQGIDRPALHARLVRDTLGYARRQMAWFRKNLRIYWVKSAREAEGPVRKFMASRNRRDA